MSLKKKKKISISALLQGSFEEWISSFYLIAVVLQPPDVQKVNS